MEKQYLEVVGLVSENFWRHVSVAACLACELKFRVQVITGMLIDRQRLAEPKICQLDGACVKYQVFPAANRSRVRKHCSAAS